MKSNSIRTLGILTALTGAALANAGISMSSDLYLSSGDEHHVIRNDVLQNSWQAEGSEEFAIAVADTVRSIGWISTRDGHEYTLAGTYTGVSYSYPAGMSETYDGTTDLTSNYTVGFGNGFVYRLDREWANPTPLFSVVSTSLGITYDFTDNSLWVASWFNPTITHYAMDGTVLGSFDTGLNAMTCLALDHATGVLWFGSQLTAGTFYAFMKDGTQVGSTHVSAIVNDNTLGGEFQAVPEPATIVGLALGAVFAMRMRRRA